MNSRNPRCHRIALSAVFVFLLGCENAPPKIETVILNRNPNPSVPLAAILTVATNEPTRAVVRLDDGERTWDVTSSEELATEHKLTVLGMRSVASSSYRARSACRTAIRLLATALAQKSGK